MHSVEVFIPIVLFISIATVLIVYRKFMNEERLAMIEKGADPSQFNIKHNYGNAALKIGLLLMGAGLGLFLGSFFARINLVEEEAAYFSMVLIFGGFGLFSAYLIEKKNEKEVNR